MRPYELVVLLHPDLEIDVDTPTAKLEKMVEAAGGKVTRRDNWGKKRLAYRIKHHDFAVYIYFEVMLDPSKAQSIERNLLLAEEVMRYLFVSKEVVKEVESAKKPKALSPAKTDQEKEAVSGKEL
jgi:small subunit ribosomal protein S6